MDFSKAYKIILTGGVLFAVLFSAGYLFLSSYFAYYEVRIPFDDFSYLEVAHIGFYSLLVFTIVSGFLFLFFIYLPALNGSVRSFFNIRKDKTFYLISYFSLLLLVLFYYYTYWSCSEGIICSGFAVSLLYKITGTSYLKIMFYVFMFIYINLYSLFLYNSINKINTIDIRKSFAGVFLLLIYFFFTKLYAYYAFSNNLAYNFNLNPSIKNTAVEIIYDTPLVNPNVAKNLSEDNADYYNKIQVQEYKGGDIKIEGKDLMFEAESGVKKFIRNFELLFESKDSYYLLPTSEDLIGYAAIIGCAKTGKNIDDPNIKCSDMELGRIKVKLYNAIVLPKNKVDSIKYLNIPVKSVPTYKDFFNGQF